ncbi:hypothetical protein CDCA_CDCA07G2269 [Cyanidium caldarium]|uniref:Glycosyltransferase 61 catalytic domain-containing protein n=1 Tax=Cyanidium caldarium TaxID=2771 RepID=A0AAV9IVE4_CYACA|nr:hypothetical protein CDCA_CDCA07G2269 [Cyanidium caldarium]
MGGGTYRLGDGSAFLWARWGCWLLLWFGVWGAVGPCWGWRYPGWTEGLCGNEARTTVGESDSIRSNDQESRPLWGDGGAEAPGLQLHRYAHRKRSDRVRTYTERVLEVRGPVCVDVDRRQLQWRGQMPPFFSSSDSTLRDELLLFLQERQAHWGTAASAPASERLLPGTWVVPLLTDAARINVAHFMGEVMGAWAVYRRWMQWQQGNAAVTASLHWWRPHHDAARSALLHSCGRPDNCTADDDARGGLPCAVLSVLAAAMPTPLATRDHFSSALASERWLCVQHLIVPGLLKSRFFHTYADATAFREALFTRAGIPPESTVAPAAYPLQVTFLSRGAADGSAPHRRRRRLRNEAELLHRLQQQQRSLGYRLQVIDASRNTTTRAQLHRNLRVLRDTHTLISVHGAQLVYAALLPPYRSVLIELWPHAFTHDMYVQAGGAAIGYYAVESRRAPPDPPEWLRPSPETPVPAAGAVRRNLTYGERRACVEHSERCRAYYRDADVWADIDAVLDTLAEALAAVRRARHESDAPAGRSPAANTL